MSRAAAITTIGSWEADGVSVGRVEEAVLDLRRNERRAAVRTSVLTLVAVVGGRDEADIALSTIHDLGARHPSRSLVIILAGGESTDDSTVDASASVHVIEKEGRAVCFEEVVLTVRGRARHHLDSVVEPFTLPDVPLVVWLPARLPSAGDPLMGAADRVVVDSRAVKGREEVLLQSARLARRLPVADLSWIRLAPWRSLLAGLFQGPVYRPFLDHVERVEIAGKFGPTHLLGGWLLKRLGLPVERVHLVPSEHVSVCINGTSGGRAGHFAVQRTEAARVITSRVDIDGGPTLEQTLRMREQWPSLALAGALTRFGHDPIYEEALSGARELIG